MCDTEESWAQLMTNIRQQGHFTEGPFVGQGPVGMPPSVTMFTEGGGTEQQDAFYGGSAGPMFGNNNGPERADVFYEQDGNPVCSHCSSYLYDEEWDCNETDTDDDDDPTNYHPEELRAYLGCAKSELPNVETLHDEYLFAKRRFRFAAGRGPRHQRFPRTFHKGKGKGKGKGKFQPRQAFASMPFPRNSLAGGKGNAGHGRTGNPLASNGKPLECFGCGSRDHLIKDCPKKGASFGFTTGMVTGQTDGHQGAKTGYAASLGPLAGILKGPRGGDSSSFWNMATTDDCNSEHGKQVGWTDVMVSEGTTSMDDYDRQTAFTSTRFS